MGDFLLERASAVVVRRILRFWPYTCINIFPIFAISSGAYTDSSSIKTE
jgi:hypothetical protein